jgi:hypothetical protein
VWNTHELEGDGSIVRKEPKRGGKKGEGKWVGGKGDKKPEGGW